MPSRWANLGSALGGGLGQGFSKGMQNQLELNQLKAKLEALQQPFETKGKDYRVMPDGSIVSSDMIQDAADLEAFNKLRKATYMDINRYMNTKAMDPLTALLFKGIGE